VVFEHHRSALPAFDLDYGPLVDEEAYHFDDITEGAAGIIAKVEDDAVDVFFLQLDQFLRNIDIAAITVLVLEIGVEFGKIDIADLAFVGVDDDAAGELLILDDLIADEGNDLDGAIGLFEGKADFSAFAAADDLDGVGDGITGEVDGFLAALGNFEDGVADVDLA